MRMWHGDGPLVPPSDLEFLYIAPVPPKWLLCAHPAEDKAISEPTATKWRIPEGRAQAISYTPKKSAICAYLWPGVLAFGAGPQCR